MKTTDLIDLLAAEAGPAPRALASRRLTPAVALGVLIGAVLALAWLGPIPSALWHQPAPWVKLGYATALAAGAIWLTARLGRPLASTRGPWRALGLIALAAVLVGGVSLLEAPAGERLAMLLGHSWSRCPVNILALSLPALGGVLWALRGLAPIRPRLAGLAAGLLAGALGALGYALSCTEVSLTFIAVWYSLGIALTGGLGFLLGPWVLRW